MMTVKTTLFVRMANASVTQTPGAKVMMSARNLERDSGVVMELVKKLSLLSTQSQNASETFSAPRRTKTTSNAALREERNSELERETAAANASLMLIVTILSLLTSSHSVTVMEIVEPENALML